MITNDVQYRNTKTLLAQFEQAALNLEADVEGATNPKLARLQIDATRAQAADLASEIAEYELLRSGTTRAFEADSLSGLASILVRARIARGWSQRRLADELGVAEQQVQRYEANGYATASLARLCDVVDALGLTVRESGELLSDPAA